MILAQLAEKCKGKNPKLFRKGGGKNREREKRRILKKIKVFQRKIQNSFDKFRNISKYIDILYKKHYILYGFASAT